MLVSDMTKLQPDLPLSLAPVPAVHKTSSRKREFRRNATGNVSDALGPVTKGCEIFALTNGQFFMIDVIEHILSFTGRATIDLATWTAADGDIRRAHAFLLDNRVERCRFIVDPSFRSRKPEFCDTLVQLFGNDAVRTTPLHGKFTVIRNAEWSVAVRSSMNLNMNRRIETVEISEDPALADFLTSLTDEIFSRSAEANFASQSLTQNARHDIASKLAF